MKRSKLKLTYHGRSGRPVLHKTEANKTYIMVRKRGGGVKRLYLVKGRVPLKYKAPIKHKWRK